MSKFPTICHLLLKINRDVRTCAFHDSVTSLEDSITSKISLLFLHFFEKNEDEEKIKLKYADFLPGSFYTCAEIPCFYQRLICLQKSLTCPCLVLFLKDGLFSLVKYETFSKCNAEH